MVSVLPGHLPHILGSLVAPAALRQTKGPLGRDVAAPDELTELPGDVVRAAAGEHIEVVVRRLCREPQGTVGRVADVVGNFAREIDEKAEVLLSGSAVDEQKIVCTVVGTLVLTVVRLVGVICNVMPAALIDAAGHLAQTVHDRIRSHRIAPPAVRFGGEEGHSPFRNGKFLHHTVGGQGRTKTKTLDHSAASFSHTYILRPEPLQSKRQNRRFSATKPAGCIKNIKIPAQGAVCDCKNLPILVY